MIVYFLLIIFIILSYFSSRKKENPDKEFLVIVGIVLIIVLGSRNTNNAFADEGSYYRVFVNSIDKTLSTIQFEMSDVRDNWFYYTMWGIAQVFPWGQFIVYFTTAVFFIPTLTYIYMFSENKLCSVLLLFGSGLYSFCMSAYRQSWAMMCCIIAYCVLVKKNNDRIPLKRILMAAIWVYISYRLHRSAVVFLPVFGIVLIRNKRIKATLTGIASILIILFREQLFAEALSIMEKDYVPYFGMSLVGHVIEIILLSFPLLFYFFSYNYRFTCLSNLDESNDALNKFILSIVSVLFFALRTFAQAFERISYYYMLFVFCAYSDAIDSSFSRKTKEEVYLIVNLLCVALFLWRQFGKSFTFFWA